MISILFYWISIISLDISCNIIVFLFQGIANALDLTDRVLPRLQTKLKCRFKSIILSSEMLSYSLTLSSVPA